MNRKQLLIQILSFTLFFSTLPAIKAIGEPLPASTDLRGLVLDISEDSVLISDPNVGNVHLTLTTETVMEGVLARTPLTKGMYIVAKCDRIPTSSMPQSLAQRLGCYPLQGIIRDVMQNGVLLSGDPVFGDVVVQFPEHNPHIYPDVPITVYYDGTMTLSLPATVSANHIVVPTVEGVVFSASENSFVMHDTNGESFTVRLSDTSTMPENWSFQNAEGHRIVVYYNGETVGGFLTALEVVGNAFPPIEEEALPGIPDNLALPGEEKEQEIEDPSLPPADDTGSETTPADTGDTGNTGHDDEGLVPEELISPDAANPSSPDLSSSDS